MNKSSLLSTEEKLKRIGELYSDLPGALCLVKGDGSYDLFFVNKELLRIYQCRTEEIFFRFTGGRLVGLMEVGDFKTIGAMLNRLGLGDSTRFEFSFKTWQGRNKRIVTFAKKVHFEGVGECFVLQMMDTSVFEDSSEIDVVTGLYGEHGFYRRAKELDIFIDDMYVDFSKYCTCYFDLKNFKLFNATRGSTQGDVLLQKLADTLRSYFPNSLLAHLSADTFIALVDREHITITVGEICKEVHNYVKDPSISLKVGICLFDTDYSGKHTLRQTVDFAKVACDTIKFQDNTHFWAFYTKEMGRQVSNRAFVLRKFHKALASGDIRVYFQPVVRTLTGKICGMEALARWKDEKKGMIMPGVFIPTLEDTGLIHLLDAYIIEEVAKRYRYMKDRHMDTVPISINLSQEDFDLMDPFAYIEGITKKYGMPRDCLRIEITESAIAKNGSRLKHEINRFRKAGYQCWQDDFGSGYSSLNALHDYHFDEIKIDMGFMRRFNEQSKKIVRSIVLMAKSLGMHILAEGVETEEHVDFLRQIGCEKIQGYYYGKPMDFDELQLFIRDKMLQLEGEEEGHMFERAGLINVITDFPVGLILDNGTDSVLFYANQAYNQARDGDKPKSNTDPLGPLDPERQKRFRAFMDRVISSDKEEMLTFVDKGQYKRIKANVVAKGNNKYIVKASLINMDIDDALRITRKLDQSFRYLMRLYNGVYHYSKLGNTFETLQGVPFLVKEGGNAIFEPAAVKKAITELVHPEDCVRFYDMLCPENMEKLCDNDPDAIRGGYFRTKKADGSYHWVVVQSITPEEGNDIYFCVKESILEASKNRRDMLRSIAKTIGISFRTGDDYGEEMDSCLMESLRNHTAIRCFCKDTKGRYVGVSRAFMNYYGIEQETDILGKTDDEMEWHVDVGKVKERESEVLNKGASYTFVGEEVISKGRIRRQLASRYPVYRGNKIIGILGYYIDQEERESLQASGRAMELVDTETGLLNYRGMLAEYLHFQDFFIKTGKDYVSILLRVPEYPRISQNIPPKSAEKLRKKLVSIFREIGRYNQTLCRLGDNTYLILRKDSDQLKTISEIQKAVTKVEATNEIDGFRITLSLDYSMGYGAEVQSPEDMVDLLLRRMAEGKNKTVENAINFGDQLVMDRSLLDYANDRVVFITLDSHEIAYMNHAFKEDLGIDDDSSIIGKKCYEILGGYKEPCPNCPMPQKWLDSVERVHYHNRISGMDYIGYVCLIHWKGKPYHYFRAIALEDIPWDKINQKQFEPEFIGKAQVKKAIEAAGGHTNLTLFCADLNGLKQINALEGFDKGNQIIARTVDILSQEAGSVPLYRVAGDAFYLLVFDRSEEEIEAIEDRLRASFQKQSIRIAMAWHQTKAPVKNPDYVINEAERKMFLDKRQEKDKEGFTYSIHK